MAPSTMTVAELIERLQKASPTALVLCFNSQFMSDLVEAEAYRMDDGAVVIHEPDWGGAVL